MTLKEKFNNPIMRHDLMRNEIEETKEQLEKITEDFAIGFAEWLEKQDWEIYHNNTAGDLLEIYKKEKGL